MGAQWLLVDAPNAAAVVALVQVANTLPVMLLAMPAGVLADAFDKRWLLFVVQVYFLVAGVSLLVLTLAGLMPPSLLLVFTFLLGVGGGGAAAGLAGQHAGAGAAAPDPVGRPAGDGRHQPVPRGRAGAGGSDHRRFGVRDGVRAERAVGDPAGCRRCCSGVAPRPRSAGGRERFWPALRAGGRYAWHDTAVRRILVRLAVFLLPGVGAVGAAAVGRDPTARSRARVATG